MDEDKAKRRGIHGVCTVTEDHGTRFALCIGPAVGGKQLADKFWPQDLAVAKETGWMMLHYAVAQGCGQDVVAMVLHAHMEVSPRHTHPLWREGTRCTVGSDIVAERALLAKCSGTWGGAVMVAVGWCRLLPVWVCPPGTLSCLQAAAVRDARGMLPLALAAQTGACAGVKDMLYEAYPEATAGVALHEVLLWGAKAVSHAISAQPEVQCEMFILPSMLLLLHHVPWAGRMCTCDLQPMCGWWCPYAEGVRCSTGSCYSYYCKVAKLGCELVTALPERRTPCFVASCFVIFDAPIYFLDYQSVPQFFFCIIVVPPAARERPDFQT